MLFNDEEAHPSEDNPNRDSDLRSKYSKNGVDGNFNRLEHFTWAWFSCTMATGAVSLVVASIPFRFNGLDTIAKIFYILDLALFVLFSCCITARFVLTGRKALWRSLQHPNESLLVGAFWVSIALILSGAAQLAPESVSPWLFRALHFCFWVYAGLAFITGVVQYEVLFIKARLRVSQMMPAWILPIYPLLVIGSTFGPIVSHQSQQAAVRMITGALMFQGLGWMVSFFMYTIFMIRLMTAALPEPSVRPGMFISVGPTGYTSAAFVQLGIQAQKQFPPRFLGITQAPIGDHLAVIGIFAGIFLWLLSFWFFCLSIVGVIDGFRKRPHFTLNWWALVFPNGGLILAAIHIGNALESDGVKAVSEAMALLLVIAWVIVAYCNIMALCKRDILWPGIDEDSL